MGIIDRIRKSDAAPTKGPKKTTKKAAVVTSDVTAEATVAKAPKALPAWALKLIRRPRVTEKASRLAQEENVYTFDVPVDAEKIAIKKTIEQMYKVRVLSVHTIRGEGKIVRRGRIEGQRNRWKKALVKVAAGQTIDIYASAS